MFFLRKEWREADDGVEMVVLHWATTRHDQQPNWRRAHPTTMMLAQPTTYPMIRSGSVWVAPPFTHAELSTLRVESDARFLLHTFCEVTQRGRTWSTDVTVQEIRAQTITHTDTVGEYTHACIYYGLDEQTYGNRVPMRVDGLAARYQGPPVLPDRSASDKDYRRDEQRTQRLAQLPPPHVFRGQIWGPVGARVLYSIYLRRQWTYNPFAEGGMWVLQNGRPWEIRL